MVCNATTYFVLRAFFYVGKEETKVGLGDQVILSLMEPYRNKRLNVTATTFFISLSLARKLLLFVIGFTSFQTIKCRMCQSNKAKVKYANCLLSVCGKHSASVCHTCLHAVDFDEGIN